MDAATFESHLRSHPEDPEANLVYADWLEDAGDAGAYVFRCVGQGAEWCAGNRRGAALEAMRFGYNTRFTLSIGRRDVAYIEAEHELWRFALWCARTSIDSLSEEARATAVHPELLSILEDNERWLVGERPQQTEPPEYLREVGGRINRICRMASYGVALSAAKYTSNYVQHLGVDLLNRDSQLFEWTRMLAASPEIQIPG